MSEKDKLLVILTSSRRRGKVRYVAVKDMKRCRMNFTTNTSITEMDVVITKEEIEEGYPELDTDTHEITLEPPDMEQLRLDRLERNREVMKLEVLLEDNITTRRNKARHYLSYIITIQRAWKAYVKRKQANNSEKNINCSDVTENTIKQSSDIQESTEVKEIKKYEKLDISNSLENIRSISRESTPDDRLSYQNKNSVLQKFLSDREPDTESLSSDYSEVSAPLRDIAEAELQKLDNGHNTQKSESSYQKSSLTSTQVEKQPGESDEDYSRRLRKINLLSIAQEFAELKKINVNALPLDLHKVQGHTDESSLSASSSASNSAISSEMNTPVDSTVSFENMKNINSLTDTDLNSNTIHSSMKTCDKNVTDSIVNSKDLLNSSPKNKRNIQNVQTGDRQQCDRTSNIPGEKEGDFDVFNIETAMPQMDWEGLEKQLQQATEEQKKRSEAQRNDREEIRRKLAMGTGVEEDYYGSERTSYNKKPNLSSRLQTGMNLQICFMNESPSEEQNLTQDKISNELELKDEYKTLAAAKDTQSDVNKNTVSKSDVKNGNSVLLTDDTIQKQDDGDFFKQQARLQREAKIALAQVGIPYLNDLEKGQRFNKKILYEMNIAQLQVVVNDLHSQIENLNEDLVKFLMDRDELHMEQDSKLVDIEDLTRRAEERAGKVNTRQKKESRKS
ncbi:hypothetical protein KUTeg_012575 [Tegillarca granosa]|uniref:Schwannomin interacting protein 1 C-terminal domain-containing protein n=1 Tax=Tegillarca granosa TaxID=220873 RepID=A0ABQ9F567_TEGGR|nr:hypothetical protein KUTeg_012575 [Tegillarca granosa]